MSGPLGGGADPRLPARLVRTAICNPAATGTAAKPNGFARGGGSLGPTAGASSVAGLLSCRAGAARGLAAGFDCLHPGSGGQAVFFASRRGFAGHHAGNFRWHPAAPDYLRCLDHQPATHQNFQSAEVPQPAHQTPRSSRGAPFGNDLVEAANPRSLLESPRLWQPPFRSRRSHPQLLPKAPQRSFPRRVRAACRAASGSVAAQPDQTSNRRHRAPRHGAPPLVTFRKNRRIQAGCRSGRAAHPAAAQGIARRAVVGCSSCPPAPECRHCHHARPRLAARAHHHRQRGDSEAKIRQSAPRGGRRHRQHQRGNPGIGLIGRLGRPARRSVRWHADPAFARLNPQAVHLSARNEPPQRQPSDHPRRCSEPVSHSARTRASGKLRPRLPWPSHPAQRPRLLAQCPGNAPTQRPRRTAALASIAGPTRRLAGHR